MRMLRKPDDEDEEDLRAATMDAWVYSGDTQMDPLDQRVLWTITSMHCKSLFVHIILYMSEQEQTLPAKEH